MTQIEPKKAPTIQQFVSSDKIIASAEKTLGSRGQQFLTSILTMANSNSLIADCDPRSIYNSCLTAATLDLPINQNLGFAYIVPYFNKKTGVKEAQFQMGYKGFIQLAIRTGKYRQLGANEVYEGQLLGLDDFSGEPIFSFNSKTSDKIIGYMSYFELTNGFRKAFYMSKEQSKAHGKKYSQSYKKDFGVWQDDFDGMAKKTVLKLLLSKFAPLSTQMQEAIVEDQKVGDEYLDNKITFEVEDATIEGELINNKKELTPEDETFLDTQKFTEENIQEAFEEPQQEASAPDPEYPKGKPVLNGEITKPQLTKIMATKTQWATTKPELAKQLDDYFKMKFGDRSHKTLTKQEASEYIEYIEHLKEGANGTQE